MKIYLFVFGKLKTDGLRQAADYYKRIVRPWVSLEEIELKPIAVPDKSPQTKIRIRDQETELLLDKMKTALSGRASLRTGNKTNPGNFYLLDEKGSSKTSKQWADEITNWESAGIPAVGLCIGSSLGFSDELRRLSKGAISLGVQTLSHELARVVLLEQLYRGCSINKGHPYHND